MPRKEGTQQKHPDFPGLWLWDPHGKCQRENWGSQEPEQATWLGGSCQLRPWLWVHSLHLEVALNHLAQSEHFTE